MLCLFLIAPISICKLRGAKVLKIFLYLSCLCLLGSAALNQWIYCHYKGQNLIKFLIGCAPNGRILFILGPIPGSVNDDAALLAYIQDPNSLEGQAIKGWIAALPSGAGMVVDAGVWTVGECH
jgi:hypothetical protein